MNLIKRNGGLFPTLTSDLFENRLAQNFFGNDLWSSALMMPKANVSEDEKEFKIELSAPGLKKQDFNIEVDNGSITISCEKEDEKKEDKKKYKFREYSYESFSRSFQLPENVKEEDINASYEDGVLCLTIPKKEPKANKPKKAIKVA